MSNATSTLIPTNSPAPEHFALGYLTACIARLKHACDRGYYDADTRMEHIESEIARLASTMEQLNRELYPDID